MNFWTWDTKVLELKRANVLLYREIKKIKNESGTSRRKANRY